MAGFNWNNGGQSMNGQMNTQNQVPQQNQMYQNNPQYVNQNNMQRSYIPGRGVNTPDEVQAWEVPMDVPVSVFPKNDLSEIYIKFWGSDGFIKTLVFKRDVVNGESANSNDDIVSRLDRIEGMLKKQRYQKRPNQKNVSKDTPSDNEE